MSIIMYDLDSKPLQTITLAYMRANARAMERPFLVDSDGKAHLILGAAAYINDKVLLTTNDPVVVLVDRAEWQTFINRVGHAVTCPKCAGTAITPRGECGAYGCAKGGE